MYRAFATVNFGAGLGGKPDRGYLGPLLDDRIGRRLPVELHPERQPLLGRVGGLRMEMSHVWAHSIGSSTNQHSISHSTVAAQSQHSHSTVTAQSQRSHSTVTAQHRHPMGDGRHMSRATCVTQIYFWATAACVVWVSHAWHGHTVEMRTTYQQ